VELAAHRCCPAAPVRPARVRPDDFAEQVRRALERGSFEGYAILSAVLGFGWLTAQTMEVDLPGSSSAG